MDTLDKWLTVFMACAMFSMVVMVLVLAILIVKSYLIG